MDFFIADAMAQSGSGAGAEAFNWIFLLGMVAVFYFFLIRPQMKRQKDHQQMISALNKNDEAITQGGLLGKIIEVGENFVVMEIADNTKVKVQKQMVSQIVPKGTMKST